MKINVHKIRKRFGYEESTSIKNEYLSLSNPMDINFMIYPNPAG